MFALIMLLNLILIDKAFGQSSLTTTVHKTQAAAEKLNDLWCYTCQTMEDGDSCIDLTRNLSTSTKKCNPDEFICMVKRFSYTLSTENSTSLPKLWSLERMCASSCEAGCIIIGERTKLYACISCCPYSLCNTGKGIGIQFNLNKCIFLFELIFLLIINQNVNLIRF